MKYLFLDTETTGLDPKKDEILSLTMIVYEYESNTFEVKLDLLFRPLHHREWPEAEKINHILPRDVKNAFLISDYLNDIQNIVDECDKCFVYNVAFDCAFLENIGVDFSNLTFLDPMISYAARFNFGRWVSLSNAYFNIFKKNFDAHFSLDDTLALIELSHFLWPSSFCADFDRAFQTLNREVYHAKN